MKKIILGIAILLGALTTSTTATAQVNLPQGSFPVIITPHVQTASYRERTLCYDISANVEFTVASDADWATVRKASNGNVYVHITENPDIQPRVAHITFANAENKLSEVLVLTQEKNESVQDLVIKTDFKVKPTSASTNNVQSGSGDIKYAYDENYSTMYHSAWSGNPVSESNPAELIFNFTNADAIDYIQYYPRSGGGNGTFQTVDVYAKCGTETSYTFLMTKQWPGSDMVQSIMLEERLVNPRSIKFVVRKGVNNLASCAEMEFYKINPEKGIGYGDLFADEVYSELKPGVTQEDIDNIDEPFVSNLARQLFNKTYRKDYRVATYKCITSPSKQSDIWCAPGKQYDQLSGVTGINISKGQHAIIVSGLGNGEMVTMKVVAWFVGKYGTNFDGGNPYTTTYTLHNGVNVINYTYDYDGLAYICYYDDFPTLRSDIKVHFVNAQINGYLHHGLSNEEMHQLCKDAPSMHMDMLSDKVHAVWESQGFYNHCKAVDGSLGYIQYMNAMDSLMTWEHRSLGFEKYNSLPDNRTFAYVNYTYYMFQGGLGVSFIHSQQSRVLNCNQILNKDDDAIWGLAHEWGHQHQMTPYFCWAGMSEITNNVQSYTCIMKFGYRTSDKIGAWAPAREYWLKNTSEVPHSKDGGQVNSRLVSSQRYLAYQKRSELSSYPNLMAAATAMADSVVTSYDENPAKAVQHQELGVWLGLTPFIMVHNYFTMNGCPDFAPDWYEALRQNDNEAGSQVEKQSTEPDKYELLAGAQNGKSGKYAKFAEKYPNSCWVKKQYVNAGSWWQLNSTPFIMNWIRKVSRLSGYNLFPYFERWGFLRQVALYVGDYGNKWYICTKEMYDEFEADMNALVESGELRAMPEGMVEEISNSPEWYHSKPTIPNK